ncbi:hypothetical protein KY285_011773 [Solanum tuberosum]|nr:hypothetical protein KY284_011876 [Solanum tuberosum]KAH0736066.1 hypothetical protein KY285_011773 [Solanum tuberosum]
MDGNNGDRRLPILPDLLAHFKFWSIPDRRAANTKDRLQGTFTSSSSGKRVEKAIQNESINKWE